MVDISIICLVYKSKQLAKAVFESLYKHTPMLKSGQAEILFVANDPTVDVVDYLREQNFPFIININDHLSDKELFELGYGTPEYMRRVYQGYNQGILQSKGNKIVLINSDNFFSPDWLENLLKYLDYKKVVTSTLIEPGQEKFGVFPGAIHQDFGKTLDDFKEEKYLSFVEKIRKTGYTSGGAYMPCLLYKDVAILAGLYPEGNIAGKTFGEVRRYGDEFFYDKLSQFGVEHITAKDSVVYHLKEGEKSENVTEARLLKSNSKGSYSLDARYKVEPVDLVTCIEPNEGHHELIHELGMKFTALIIGASSNSVIHQIGQLRKHRTMNLDIVVIYNSKNEITRRVDGVKYVFSQKSKMDVKVFQLFHSMYGEYLIVANHGHKYLGDFTGKIIRKDVVYEIVDAGVPKGETQEAISQYVISKRLLLENAILFLELILNSTNRVQEKYPVALIECNGRAPLGDNNRPEEKNTTTPLADSCGDLLVTGLSDLNKIQQCVIKQKQLIDEQRVKIDEINNNNLLLIGDNQRLSSHVHYLTSSVSWRVTKPIRMMQTILTARSDKLISGAERHNKWLDNIINKDGSKK